jgi:hypothetical protein
LDAATPTGFSSGAVAVPTGLMGGFVVICTGLGTLT